MAIAVVDREGATEEFAAANTWDVDPEGFLFLCKEGGREAVAVYNRAAWQFAHKIESA